MSHSFLVLYFGGQCPWHLWTIEQVRKAAAEVSGDVEVCDVSDKPDLAAKYRLFSPFMTAIDETIRLPSPNSAERLVKFINEGVPSELTVFQPPGPEKQARRIAPLTAENIRDTCPLCVSGDQAGGCQAKQAWAFTIKNSVREGVLGFIAYQGRKAVGVVECLPSTGVPYPLPQKDARIAFITCIYSRSIGSGAERGEEPDYRGQVLEHLLVYLEGQGARKVQVIAGRRTPYPNGPVPFFLSYGFVELSELDRVVLTEGQEELVLMEKVIRHS